MSNSVPNNLVEPLVRCPSATMIGQVKRMQIYIQSLLGETHFTFLQGSYKNDTAISDINDVDIVAVRKKTYSGTFSMRPMTQLINWDQIFLEIESKLKKQSLYLWTVTPGDKCIKVRGAFNADIVPAVQVEEDIEKDPIVIYSFRDKKEKVNYPRIHYLNGVDKNQRTSNQYKPMVRMFKNWVKNHFGEDKKIISSFKMESLVYDCDDQLFGSDTVVSFLLLGNAILEKVKAGIVFPVFLPSVCGKENIAENWDIQGKKILATELSASLQLAYEALQSPFQTTATDKWKMAFKM